MPTPPNRLHHGLLTPSPHAPCTHCGRLADVNGACACDARDDPPRRTGDGVRTAPAGDWSRLLARLTRAGA